MKRGGGECEYDGTATERVEKAKNGNAMKQQNGLRTLHTRYGNGFKPVTCSQEQSTRAFDLIDWLVSLQNFNSLNICLNRSFASL